MDGKGSNPSFDKISRKLNTTFEQSAQDVEKQLQTVDLKKKELQQQVIEKKQVAIKDQEYLLFEIKSLIQITLSVLERLDQDLKIGSESRKFEVFATLTNSVTMQLKELRELNKMIADMEIFNNPEMNKPTTNVNIEMSGKDLLDWMEKIQSEREIDRIDTSFNVEVQDPTEVEE